ncbi:MAG: hypothetical protein WCO09_03860, partial [bacterium]
MRFEFFLGVWGVAGSSRSSSFIRAPPCQRSRRESDPAILLDSVVCLPSESQPVALMSLPIPQSGDSPTLPDFQSPTSLSSASSSFYRLSPSFLSHADLEIIEEMFDFDVNLFELMSISRNSEMIFKIPSFLDRSFSLDPEEVLLVAGGNSVSAST